MWGCLYFHFWGCFHFLGCFHFKVAFIFDIVFNYEVVLIFGCCLHFWSCLHFLGCLFFLCHLHFSGHPNFWGRVHVLGLSFLINSMSRQNLLFTAPKSDLKHLRFWVWYWSAKLKNNKNHHQNLPERSKLQVWNIDMEEDFQ